MSFMPTSIPFVIISVFQWFEEKEKILNVKAQVHEGCE